MPHFDALNIYSCGKHCEKRKNCLKQAISPFLTMLSALYVTFFPFYMHFKISSAICFYLDQSKILSSGKGLNPFCRTFTGSISGMVLFFMQKSYIQYMRTRFVNAVHLKIYLTEKETSHKKYISQFSLHLHNKIVYMCNDKILVQQ